MADTINGVPIGDLPGIESVPDDSMLVVEFLGKAYSMPGAVLRQMIQDVLDAMGGSVDDVTEARLTAAIEKVLAEGRYNGVSPIVEVLDEEDGTSVIHVIDAFGVKKYPVRVKGARNAVQYVPQKLTEPQKTQARENIGAVSADDLPVIVKISGGFLDPFTVLLDGLPVSDGVLNELVRNGSIVVGVVDDHATFMHLDETHYRLPHGTIFRYLNGAFLCKHGVSLDNKEYVLKYENGIWDGDVFVDQYTFYLSADYPGRVVECDGTSLLPDRAYILLEDAIANNRNIFCYQKDAVFELEDGSEYTPHQSVPFYYDHNTHSFSCENDGYECTLTVEMFGYTATAKKTTPLSTAESKGDDLKLDPIANTLSLLSAGEPIGKPIPLPTGGGTGEGGGVIAPVNGFFTLSVDSDGNLWAHSAEGGTTPDFEYDSETGNLYFLTEQE